MAKAALKAAVAPLRIAKLVGKNFKGLVAIEIDLEGNVIEICGPNGSGKSSVMDIVSTALGGKDEVPDMPIRQGETESFLQVDLAEGEELKMRVTRTFKMREDGKTFIDRLRVENADGFKATDPQTQINGVLGKYAFDPFDWDRLKMPEKFESLKGFVPGVDFAAIAKADADDRKERRDINRDAEALQAQIDAIVIPEDAATEKVDEAALVTEISEVANHNAEIEDRKRRRILAGEKITSLRQQAADAKDDAAALRRQADEMDAKATAADAEADALAKRLAEAPELEKPKDVTEVRARLDAAKAVNALVDLRAKRDDLVKQHADLKAKSDALTASIRKREADKVAAIAAADLPVKGLGFGKNHKGEDIVTLNDIPLDQCNTAERLRTSIAIAMAANPRLRTLRINEGSLLDRNSMKILGEMCAGKNYQALVEVVSDEPKSGFFIEAGRIREPASAGGESKAAE